MLFHARTGRSSRGRQLRAVTLVVLLVASVVVGAVGFVGTSLATDTGSGVASASTPDETGPTADAGSNKTAGEDWTVHFDGSGSSGDDEIERYLWDLNGDGVTNADDKTPSHTYAKPGTYEATLTVVDGSMHTDTDTVTVTVRDVTPPNAETGPDTTIGVGSLLQFDASDSTDNDAIDQFRWDFDGDGRTDATGERPIHTFDQSGATTVTLTVTDPAGHTDTDTVTITVESDTRDTDESTTSDTESSDNGSGDSSDASGDDTATGGSSDGSEAGSAGSSADSTNSGHSDSTDGPDTASTGAGANGDVPAGVSVTVADRVTTIHVEDGTGPRDIELANASDGRGVSVDAITIDTNASEFTLNVSEHRRVPENLTAPNRTTVGDATAGYLEIAHSVPEKAIAGVDLTFTVGWDQLVNGTTASEVTLYRYHGGEWQPLETTFLEYTENGARLAAQSPGLSVFAVGSRLRSNITVDPTVHPERRQVGDPVNVTAQVTNHGTAPGLIVVGLQVDNETLDTASVPLDPGQATTLQLAPTFERAGSYDIVVEGIDAGTVSVTTEPVSTATPTPEPSHAPNASATASATATPTSDQPESATAVPDGSERAAATNTGSTADRASGPGPGMSVATLGALALLAAVVRRRD